MLRIIYFILFSGIMPGIMVGQQMPPPQMKTLLAEGARISAFGSINSGASPFNHRYAGYVGGDGALVFNNFFLGGFGSRNIEFQTIDTDDEYYTGKKLGMSQGGVLTGMSFGTKRLIQYTVAMQTGWGYLLLRDNLEKRILARDRINIFTPALQAKANITSYIQLCVGISCQFTLGVDFPALADNDFQGLCGSLSLRFGWF